MYVFISMMIGIVLPIDRGSDKGPIFADGRMLKEWQMNAKQKFNAGLASMGRNSAERHVIV